MTFDNFIIFCGHNYPGGTWDAVKVRYTAMQALNIAGVEGATIMPAAGLWQGMQEETSAIICAGITEEQANYIAAIMAYNLQQDCCMVMKINAAFTFIDKEAKNYEAE